MLNLSRLRMLRELRRLGTLTEVANSLSYTPSAISQQLAVLEREVGVQLLERSGRRVLLTADAIALVEHTEVVLARLERAEVELAAAQTEVRGTLRVASFQSVLLSIGPIALTLLAERHPELQVEITQREVTGAYEGLLAHDFDLILGEEYPGVPEPHRAGVDREDFTTDALRLAMPTTGPFAELESDITALAGASWAVDPESSTTGRWERATCRAAGFEAIVRFETTDPLLHAHLVRTGHAVSFMSEIIAAQHLAGMRLVALPGDPHRVLFTAVRDGRAGHPAIRAFREALTEAASQATP